MVKANSRVVGNDKKRIKSEDTTGIFIPAGLLIGIGIGLLIGEIAAWTLLGLGVGFF
jgi:hypothetical protein